MSVEQYWIGKNIDLEKTWDDFESGSGYIKKFGLIKPYLFELSFSQPEAMPLFNQEAIYKTIKSYYHEIKKVYLPGQYNQLSPLFLYEIRRGSAEWSFLSEIPPTLFFLADFFGVHSLKDILEIFMYGVAVKEFFSRRNTSSNNKHTQFCRDKLKSQGLKGAKISKFPFNGNPKKTREDSIDLIL